MDTTRTNITLAITLALALAGLGGCGSGDDSGGASPGLPTNADPRCVATCTSDPADAPFVCSDAAVASCYDQCMLLIEGATGVCAACLTGVYGNRLPELGDGGICSPGDSVSLSNGDAICEYDCGNASEGRACVSELFPDGLECTFEYMRTVPGACESECQN